MLFIPYWIAARYDNNGLLDLVKEKVNLPQQSEIEYKVAMDISPVFDTCDRDCSIAEKPCPGIDHVELKEGMKGYVKEKLKSKYSNDAPYEVRVLDKRENRVIIIMNDTFLSKDNVSKVRRNVLCDLIATLGVSGVYRTLNIDINRMYRIIS